MSDKPFHKLLEIEQILRRLFPAGPAQDDYPVTIRMVSGFELFNTRPYHNYETWSSGWRIEGAGVVVEREDLDDAVKAFAERVLKEREKAEERA